MTLLRHSVLICKLLLITLSASVLMTASANNFTYSKPSANAKTVMAITLVDCQSNSKADNNLKKQLACHELTKPVANSGNTSSSCSCSINVLTLFPATPVVDFDNYLSPSLLLIKKDQNVKTYTFSERIDRPPIV